MTGRIERIPERDGKPRDFAFIIGEDGKNYFLHISKFQSDWKKLTKSSFPVKVTFDAIDGPKGPAAENCVFFV